MRTGRCFTSNEPPQFTVAGEEAKDIVVRGFERATPGALFIAPIQALTSRGPLAFDVAFTSRRSKGGRVVFGGLFANGNKLSKTTIELLDEARDESQLQGGMMSYMDIGLGADIEVTARMATSDLFRFGPTENGSFTTTVTLTAQRARAKVEFAPTAQAGSADGLTLTGIFANGNTLGRATLMPIGMGNGRFITRPCA